MTPIDETPAAKATRARCRYVELVINGRRATMDPVITPDGRLNSCQTIGPAAEGGGYVVGVVEAAHAAGCPALRAGRCGCGAQTQLDALILG